MLVPDRRTLIVLASLVGAMTIASGLLLVLEPGPATSVDGMSLSSVGPQRRADGGLFGAGLPAVSGRWSTVVVHYGSSHSHTGQSQHRPSASAYHFVVRGGDVSWGDRLEIGSRWNRQQAGAYWVGPESQWVNHHGVGISVEKDSPGQGPTDEQLQKLVWLVQRLQVQYQIPADRVILQVESSATKTGGRWFPIAWFRQQLLTFTTS